MAQSSTQSFNINQCYFEFVSSKTALGYTFSLKHFSAQGTLLFDRVLAQGPIAGTVQWNLVFQNVNQTIPLFYNLLNNSLYEGKIVQYVLDQENFIVKPFDLGVDYDNYAIHVIRRIDNNSVKAIEMPFEICLRFRDSETF